MAKKSNPAADSYKISRDAKRAAEEGLQDAIPALVGHFHRIMTDPARLDRGCLALTEIVAALYALDCQESELWLTAIHHVQMEPTMGGSIDTAAMVRGHAASGLARTLHPDKGAEIVRLLADAEPAARIGAARALGMLPGETGALLLRYKVLIGDPHREVIAECFNSLLAADAPRSIEFVEGYCTDPDPEIAEAAALALGDSRLIDAVEALKRQWMRVITGPIKETLLLALATARREESLEFLLKLLQDENLRTANEVVHVLRIYRHDDTVRSKVEEIANRRGLEKAFRAAF